MNQDSDTGIASDAIGDRRIDRPPLVDGMDNASLTTGPPDRRL